jgi:hypothetical protein
VLLYQIAICFFYGYWFRYTDIWEYVAPTFPPVLPPVPPPVIPNANVPFDEGSLQLVAMLSVLAIVGIYH